MTRPERNELQEFMINLSQHMGKVESFIENQKEHNEEVKKRLGSIESKVEEEQKSDAQSFSKLNVRVDRLETSRKNVIFWITFLLSTFSASIIGVVAYFKDRLFN